MFLPEPAIITGEPMLLAGIRRRHKMSEAAVTIPQQWEEFRAHPWRHERAPRAFGVFCSATDQVLEYMTAIEVESFDEVPGDMGRMRVPTQRYAVFAFEEHVSKVAAAWERIWTAWLPGSGYEDAETPAFELYDLKFDPATGDGGFEIWFPIRR